MFGGALPLLKALDLILGGGPGEGFASNVEEDFAGFPREGIAGPKTKKSVTKLGRIAGSN